MDSFESIVATIMKRQGFWVRTSHRVNISKQEKREMGRPSSPRWEIDVIAYRPGDNLLRVIECKSYLDSGGVGYKSFHPSHKNASRYKLFTEEVTRRIVFGRLEEDLVEEKSILPNPTIRLCLAAGKIRKGHVKLLREFFDEKGWHLFDPTWIREQLHLIAGESYDNAIASVTAKLLLRGKDK